MKSNHMQKHAMTEVEIRAGSRKLPGRFSDYQDGVTLHSRLTLHHLYLTEVKSNLYVDRAAFLHVFIAALAAIMYAFILCIFMLFSCVFTPVISYDSRNGFIHFGSGAKSPR